MTTHLLARAGRVIAIEIDPYLARNLAQKCAGEERLEVVAGDALTVDLSHGGLGAVVAGNLPYYAATAILERLCGAELRRGAAYF